MKIIVSSRQGGKTLAIKKLWLNILKPNPEATIVHYKNGQAIIEKPVKQIKRKQIEAKS